MGTLTDANTAQKDNCLQLTVYGLSRHASFAKDSTLTTYE